MLRMRNSHKTKWRWTILNSHDRVTREEEANEIGRRAVKPDDPLTQAERLQPNTQITDGASAGKRCEIILLITDN